MAKDAYYFSHDANARNDEKVLMLRAEHGMEGYGIYWALLEMMFESTDTTLSHDKLRGLSVSYNVDITLLESVINTCISERLFVSDGEKFWSESLLRRKGKFQDLKKKRSEAGKKGMAKRWSNQTSDNTVITNDNKDITSEGTDITKNNKGKEKKVKESKVNKIKYKDYVSMTSEQYEKLLEQFGESGTEERMENLNLYKGSTGKKYKDDYLTILAWERKNKKNKKQVSKEDFNLS